MNKEKNQVVIENLRERIAQAKAEGLQGKHITKEVYDILSGKVLTLWELELITLEEANRMTNDLGVANVGCMEVVQ